jgi:hypothetical protein
MWPFRRIKTIKHDKYYPRTISDEERKRITEAADKIHGWIPGPSSFKEKEDPYDYY